MVLHPNRKFTTHKYATTVSVIKLIFSRINKMYKLRVFVDPLFSSSIRISISNYTTRSPKSLILSRGHQTESICRSESRTRVSKSSSSWSSLETINRRNFMYTRTDGGGGGGGGLVFPLYFFSPLFLTFYVYTYCFYVFGWVLRREEENIFLTSIVELPLELIFSTLTCVVSGGVIASGVGIDFVFFFDFLLFFFFIDVKSFLSTPINRLMRYEFINCKK